MKQEVDNKLEMFLRMQEHPEDYNDEDIIRMLDDDDIRKIYRTMQESEAAMNAADTTEVRPADEEPARQPFTVQRRSGRSLLRYAAAIAGPLILVTGLAFATIHLVRSGSALPANKNSTAATTSDSSRRATPQTLPIKIFPTKHAPVIFQNVTLETILQQVSKAYGCQVTYRSDTARNIRLYLQWDKKDSLDDFIGKINHFEKVHISRSQNTLTVE